MPPRPHPARPQDTPPPAAPPPWSAAAPPAPVAGAPLADASAAPGREPQVSRRAVVGVATFFLIWLYLFTVITHTESAPRNALVYASPETRSYYSPSCAAGKRAPVLTTIERAESD